MNPRITYFLLLILSCHGSFATVLSNKNNFWRCVVHDKSNKEWSVQNIYQKIAINLAFAICKKESTIPTSCISSLENCEEFHQGRSIQPKWVCTALDSVAQSWQSNTYLHREDAALAAKAYCRQNSSVPATCYINLVTCRNLHDWS